MKKILLVEDDPNKILLLKAYLDEIRNQLPDFDLEIQKSYQSGLNSLLNNTYDLLLLDMSMHNFDKSPSESGGEFMKFAGEDILREMSWHNILVKTIIVTQYDLIGNRTLKELKDSWEKEFKNVYLGTVYYSAKEVNWRNDLLNFLRENL